MRVFHKFNNSISHYPLHKKLSPLSPFKLNRICKRYITPQHIMKHDYKGEFLSPKDLLYKYTIQNWKNSDFSTKIISSLVLGSVLFGDIIDRHTIYKKKKNRKNNF